MEVKISSYGASLRRYNSSFMVTTADDESTVLAPCDVDSIEISRGMMVTTDAMLLALENDIPLVLVESSGRPMGRVWNGRANSVSSIRRGQIIFGYTHDGLEWVKKTIGEKIESQAKMIMSRWGGDEVAMKTAIKIRWISKKLHATDAPRIAMVAQEIRSIEGWAARLYFETIGRKMPERMRFERRSQHPARDGVNAMLNYGYGMLSREVEDAVMRCGLDPSMGILHDNKRVSSSYFVYDIMEPYRVWVDEVVLALIESGMADETCYEMGEGSVVLTEKGRQMLTIAMKAHMGGVASGKGECHSRSTKIKLDVQAFAQKMKSYENRELL